MKAFIISALLMCCSFALSAQDIGLNKGEKPGVYILYNATDQDYEVVIETVYIYCDGKRSTDSFTKTIRAGERSTLGSPTSKCWDKPGNDQKIYRILSSREI